MLHQTVMPTKPEAKVIMVITMLNNLGTEHTIICPDWKVDHWKSKLDVMPEIISYQVAEL